MNGRRPTRPESVLQAIIDIAGQTLHQWRSYEAVEAALANPTLRAAGQPGRTTDVPDPVHAIVASLTPYTETCLELDEALGHLRKVQTRQAILRQHHPDIAREADATIKAMRCIGTVDPTCTENWVVEPKKANKYAGLCPKCIKRVQRAEWEQRPA